MREMIRYGLILMIICAIAAGLLSGVNVLTKARILAQARAEEDASLKEVLPNAETFEAVMAGNEVQYYKAYDKDSKLAGAVFKAAQKGYSSQIETMVGVLLDGTISAIKVVSLNETPGLGSRVAENSFTDQFKTRNAAALEGVQAITGATISSSAVINSVKEKAKEILPILKNG